MPNHFFAKIRKNIRGAHVKISVICDSPLLNGALERFLKEYLSPYKNCDIVVSDKAINIDKPLFLISNIENSHLKKPFTRSQLMLKLNSFYKASKKAFPELRYNDLNPDLKDEIEEIVHNFKKEIFDTILKHYGHR